VVQPVTTRYVDISHGPHPKERHQPRILGSSPLWRAPGQEGPHQLRPEEDQGYLFANVQLPDAASLQRTDDAMKKIDAILMETEGVQYVTTVVGYSMLSGVGASYTASTSSRSSRGTSARAAP